MKKLSNNIYGNLHDLSDLSLGLYIKDLSDSIKELNAAKKLAEQEEYSRTLGIRVGEQFDFNKKCYHITDVKWIPIARTLKGDGTLSKSIRYCYRFKEWKAGTSKTPF